LDLFFGYSNWPVYSLVIIIILLSNLLNNFENFLLTFVNGHNGDRSPTFGSMNRRSTTRLQHQSLLITVYFSVIAILLPNFVCFQWNKLAICGEAYCYTFWQEKRVYLYSYMRSASTTTSLYEFFVHKNSDAVEMYEENSGTVVLVKQISIKTIYFYIRLKNCFEIRMKEIRL